MNDFMERQSKDFAPIEYRPGFFTYVFIAIFVTGAVGGASFIFYPIRLAIIALVLYWVHNLFNDTGKTYRILDFRNYITQLWSSVIIAATVIILWAFVTMFWTMDINATITGIVIWGTSFGCIFLCGQFIKTRRSATFAAWVYTIVLIIICIIGVYESFTGNYMFTTGKQENLLEKNVFGLSRPAVLFYNINNFATYVQLALPIVFIATNEMKAKHIINFVIMIIVEILIFLGGSNTAMIMFCVTFLIYVYMNKKNMMTWLIVTAVVMIIMAFSSMVLEIFSSVLSPALYSQTSQPRWQLWTNILEMCKRYNYMGISPGNATYLYSATLFEPHNYFLAILQDLGIFGLFAYLYMFVSFARAAYIGYRKFPYSGAKYCLMFCIIFPASTMCMSKMIGYYFYWMQFGIIFAYLRALENDAMMSFVMENQVVDELSADS